LRKLSSSDFGSRFRVFAQPRSRARYSITSSAVASSEGGTLRPSAFDRHLKFRRRLHRQVGRFLTAQDAIAS
jgi:hypothetical protein